MPMLDFRQVIQQIDAVGRDSLVDKVPQEMVLAAAAKAYADVRLHGEEFAIGFSRSLPYVRWQAPVGPPKVGGAQGSHG